MARSEKLKTSAVVAILVTGCVLLAGCAAEPPVSPISGEATPHKTETQSNAPTSDGKTDGQAGKQEGAGTDAGNAASCLVGTWQEDMKIFTDRVKKSTGTFDDGNVLSNISWTGGDFFRFDQKDKFIVWTENLSVSFDLDGTTNRMALDADGGGGYADGGDVIRWSNTSTVEAHLRAYEDGKLVHEGLDDSFGDFRAPSPFTCTKDTLEVNLDGDSDAPLRVFQRIANRNPPN